MMAPHKSECPVAAGHVANQSTDNAAIVAPADDSGNDKRLSTLRARACLAGVTLYAADDDHGNPIYVVSRWALTRQLDSLDAAEAWLDQVTGERA